MNRRYPPELPSLLREAGVRADDAILSEALSGLTPPEKAPPQLLRERLLATVARPRLRFAPLFGALGELFDSSDTDLAGLFERAAEPDAWQASAVPGTELFHFQGGPRVAMADNGLVRIAAGARFPSHRHRGLERVLVLDGGYRDEPSGQLYLPGDWHEMAAGTTHAYSALSERPLLLAVSLLAGVDVDGYGTLPPSRAG
jgi:quercetin dioxygenase-like cupin family protein